MDYDHVKKPIKYILGYISGFTFFIVLVVYLYMLITDHLESKQHTLEETIWIYGFLCLLIIGFSVSNYLIYERV
jgi:uncharacterized membrane protein